MPGERKQGMDVKKIKKKRKKKKLIVGEQKWGNLPAPPVQTGALSESFQTGGGGVGG